MVIYLKFKVHGVEIKNPIIGDDFKLTTRMFVNDGGFMNLCNRTDIQWKEVLQQR